MTKEWKTKEIKTLFNDILLLEDTKECTAFFRDLCTIKEIEEMSKRWQAAKLLKKGITVREIASKTGLSSATVCRISHWIKHGKGGYETMFSKIFKKNELE